MCFQFLLDFAEVHRIFDDVLVVLVDLLIHWLHEMVNIFNSTQSGHKSIGDVLPMVVYRHGFIDLRDLYVFDFALVLENFGYLRVELDKLFFELLLGHRPHIVTVLYLQDELFREKLLINSGLLRLNYILRSCHLQNLVS